MHMLLPQYLQLSPEPPDPWQQLLPPVLPDVEDLPLFFANNAGVLLEGGDGLFVDNAKGYIRLNLAMPRATIRTGLERMAEAIRKHNGK